MDAWLPNENGSAENRAAVPMRAVMRTIGNAVNELTLSGLAETSLDGVRAWLFAIDMPDYERESACQQILSDGYYAVSNIEHRVTVVCEKG